MLGQYAILHAAAYLFVKRHHIVPDHTLHRLFSTLFQYDTATILPHRAYCCVLSVKHFACRGEH